MRERKIDYQLSLSRAEEEEEAEAVPTSIFAYLSESTEIFYARSSVRHTQSVGEEQRYGEELRIAIRVDSKHRDSDVLRECIPEKRVKKKKELSGMDDFCFRG